MYTALNVHKLINTQENVVMRFHRILMLAAGKWEYNGVKLVHGFTKKGFGSIHVPPNISFRQNPNDAKALGPFSGVLVVKSVLLYGQWK